MIERIARRAGGFAATTAMRWLGAVRGAASAVDLPISKKPSAMQRARKPLTVGAATGAVALLSSNKTVRRGMEQGLRTLADRTRANGPKSGSGSKASTNAPSRNGSSNGSSSGDLSSKSRSELYELAKKKNIPGRSSMSKEELARAVKR